MLLHHCFHSIVILSVIIDFLAVLEYERPVRVQTVRLNCILYIVCTSLIERCAFDILGDSAKISTKYRSNSEDQVCLDAVRCGCLENWYLLFVLLSKSLVGTIRIVHPDNRYVAALGYFIKLTGAMAE